MLVGDVEDLPESLTQLTTTGLLRGHPMRSIEQWIDAASAADLLHASNDQYRTLSLTPLGREVMAGRVEDVQMSIPALREKRPARTGKKRKSTRMAVFHAAPVPERDSDSSVVEALRRWRLEESRRRQVPAFVVLHDRTLAAIATSLPRSPAELTAIPGIGPAKLAAYGDAVIAVVKSVVGSSQT